MKRRVWASALSVIAFLSACSDTDTLSKNYTTINGRVVDGIIRDSIVFFA